jgi:superfamily II DNA or RNA helicase
MISKEGFYVLKKSDLDEETKKKIVSDLTILPVVKEYKNAGFKFKPVPLKLLIEPKGREWNGYFCVPRFYGLEKFGVPKTNLMRGGLDISVEFLGTLYPEQIEPVEAVLKQLRMPFHSGGILSLPCGEGKTVSSIYIISQLKKKTLIVVHKEFLMNQWKEEIEMFLPSAKVGLIQGSVYQVEGMDIVLGMIQTMSKREYEYEKMNDFGLSIYDECHHLGARLFSKVLQKIPSKCILGLSAEPIRKDGMNLVFEYHMGNVIFQRERQRGDNVIVFNYILSSENQKFQNVYDRSGNKLLYKMEENIVTLYERNLFIVFLLKYIFKKSRIENEERQILVLSARNEGHLPILEELLKKHCPEIKTGYYIGRNSMSKKKHIELLTNARKCQVILGTYDMAQEGLNIKSLNAIMLASPLVGLQNQMIHGEKKEFSNDIKQTVGRILRDKTSKVQRYVYDLSDNFGNYIEWSKQRQRYYYKECYDIYKFNFDLDSLALWNPENKTQMFLSETEPFLPGPRVDESNETNHHSKDTILSAETSVSGLSVESKLFPMFENHWNISSCKSFAIKTNGKPDSEFDFEFDLESESEYGFELEAQEKFKEKKIIPSGEQDKLSQPRNVANEKFGFILDSVGEKPATEHPEKIDTDSVDSGKQNKRKAKVRSNDQLDEPEKKKTVFLFKL